MKSGRSIISGRVVSVAGEARERAGSDLDQLQTANPGALVEDPRAVKVELGDRVVVVQPPKENVALPRERQLAGDDLDALHVAVRCEEAFADEREEVFEGDSVERESRGLDEVLHRVRRDDQ
jgi:hypothetical protein